MKKVLWMVAVLAAAATSVRAQQFQQVGTGLPGPVVWSEGVDVFDANADGWLDVIFANGVGFSSAGTPLAPTLLINHTTVGGTITFADETAARLPAGFVQQAKGVIAVDVDGDGDKDLVFANAFNSQPSVLINNGAGVFTNQTATRFPTILLDSFGAGWGDVDNDGDIDLVFADAGPSAFGAPGGMAKLFRNDGTGHFANVPVFSNLANKVGAQNAQLVDVDDDLDLDLIIDGKSSGQFLYRNDGQGHFLYYPSVLPAGSVNTYATGWADLDNDSDMDGLYISLQAGTFNEGTAQNNFHPSGTLSFTGSTATIGGLNGQDDNDVVFLDANNDGILDPIVGSLGNNQEKLYLNAGTFAPNSFVYQANGFSTVNDSTLDLAVGDFDNDGDYDVVTAQGESGNFTNRVYRNTFFADTIPPRIGRVEDTPARVPLWQIRGGLARRAWIQDATYRRGETFVKASLQVAATKDGASDDFSVPMTEVGGGIHRGVIRPAASPTGTVGMDVTFSVHATDPMGNAADSAPVTFRVCGAESYDGAADGAANASPVNEPSLSANDFKVALSGLPPGRPGAMLVGTAKVQPGTRYLGGRLVIGGSFRSLPPVFADDKGRAVVDLDFTQPPLVGVQAGETRYLQFLYRDRAPGTFQLSDALEVTFCD